MKGILMFYCLCCGEQLPFKESKDGKLLCSMKCRDDINKAMLDPEYYYRKEDVCQSSTYQAQKKNCSK